LEAGAAKVALNSAIVRRPALLDALVARVGGARVVASIDARRVGGAGDALAFEVFTAGGQVPSGLDAVAWAVECERRGAGEILLTSIDRDGRRDGCDVELTRQVADAVGIPVVASGGAGAAEHFRALFETTRAAAGLAAGIFHDGTTPPAAVKRLLATAARSGSEAA
ncbi:MAG TPA: HisA/HisF-related TIM barrel protein, partial [Longimicrobiaceae bacterium]|nr:HisA/HisF-related TIM barrel protein [Longimicrobiaceae bacterium]